MEHLQFPAKCCATRLAPAFTSVLQDAPEVLTQAAPLAQPDVGRLSSSCLLGVVSPGQGLPGQGLPGQGLPGPELGKRASL